MAPSTDQLVCKQEVTGSIPVGSTAEVPVNIGYSAHRSRELRATKTLGIIAGHQIAAPKAQPPELLVLVFRNFRDAPNPALNAQARLSFDWTESPGPNTMLAFKIQFRERLPD
jgi:hypothetical protein